MGNKLRHIKKCKWGMLIPLIEVSKFDLIENILVSTDTDIIIIS